MLPGKILGGALLLVLGRKLFWLYVAVLGFAAGMTVAARLFHIQQEWVQLLVGIVFGIAGAALAYFFQHIAIGVAGFLGGAYVATSLGAGMQLDNDVLTLILFFVGGVIGAVLMVTLFDWALIVLSSLAGALLVSEGLQLAGPMGWLVVVVLLILGIVVQGSMERPPQPEERRTSSRGSTI